MLFPRSNSAITLPAVIFVIAMAVASWAQESTQNVPSAPSSQAVTLQAPQPQNYQSVDYSKPRSHFPNPLTPYSPRHVPPPNVKNTSRIGQLMHDGKIMLSIDDAVALALENNLDIAISRYNLNIADTDVLRAESGANILGVNFGVVQNTPGGGVGGLGTSVGSGTGGTSVAAGGIGAGTAGLVTSTVRIAGVFVVVGSPAISCSPASCA